MSLEFILQLADSTCHNCLSSGFIDRDSDSFLSTSWTHEDGWKLLLHDTYYTTSSTTQNPLSPYLSQASGPRFVIYLWFGVVRQQFNIKCADLALFQGNEGSPGVSQNSPRVSFLPQAMGSECLPRNHHCAEHNWHGLHRGHSEGFFQSICC